MQFLKAADKEACDQLQDLSKTLSLHVAAMKPQYLFDREVPQEVREKILDEQTTSEGKKKALDKLFGQEVFME